jgi:hypothetical protein
LDVSKKCLDCPYLGKIPGNIPVCLGMGELVLLRDLEKCPLEEVKEETKEVKEGVTPTGEGIEVVARAVKEAYETLAKISETLTELTKNFDNEDLVALIVGKTRLSKRTVRAILDAIDKAKRVGKKYALKKFVSILGNIPLKDVSIVIDEIERLNEKYVKKEDLRKILMEEE